MLKASADILFEVSWEVCNKVGGIYTVVKTKIEITKEHYPSYFLIGPYFESRAKVEFAEKEAPAEFVSAFAELEKKGIKCYFGSWQVKGEPDTILIDFSRFVSEKNNIKSSLWEEYKIDSIKSSWDYEEPIVWSTAVGLLLEQLAQSYKGKRIVAQFHEWLSGGAILYLKKKNAAIGTVFTTHATMLGRALCGSGMDLYAMLPTMDPIQLAYQSNIQDKFLTEKACAHASDVFTTVSEITAIEAEKILGRKPDIIVLNGLDAEKFPTIEEYSVKHVTCREKLREFLVFHFFPYYTFNIENTLIYFIFGRYEYKNKGVDIFIRALGILNRQLKEEKSEKTIAAFFFIPQDTHDMKTEILENKMFYRHIKNYIYFNAESIMSHILYDFVSGKDIINDDLLTKDFMLNMKKDVMRFKRKGNPPLLTHNINDESNDAILQGFRANQLCNLAEDRVKVILYPTYVDVDDGLLNLSYYDSMAGCHLGVFPSYYEPYGYTPLEASALGVPAITTDLAGFGRFISQKLKGSDDEGIFVIPRFGKDDDFVVNALAGRLHNFSQRNKLERNQNKISAKYLSSLADWKILIQHYIEAHNLAIEKVGSKGSTK